MPIVSRILFSTALALLAGSASAGQQVPDNGFCPGKNCKECINRGCAWVPSSSDGEFISELTSALGLEAAGQCYYSCDDAPDGTCYSQATGDDKHSCSAKTDDDDDSTDDDSNRNGGPPVSYLCNGKNCKSCINDGCAWVPDGGLEGELNAALGLGAAGSCIDSCDDAPADGSCFSQEYGHDKNVCQLEDDEAVGETVEKVETGKEQVEQEGFCPGKNCKECMNKGCAWVPESGLEGQLNSALGVGAAGQCYYSCDGPAVPADATCYSEENGDDKHSCQELDEIVKESADEKVEQKPDTGFCPGKNCKECINKGCAWVPEGGLEGRLNSALGLGAAGQCYYSCSDANVPADGRCYSEEYGHDKHSCQEGETGLRGFVKVH